jgi:hypothetical protein
MRAAGSPPKRLGPSTPRRASCNTSHTGPKTGINNMNSDSPVRPMSCRRCIEIATAHQTNNAAKMAAPALPASVRASIPKEAHTTARTAIRNTHVPRAMRPWPAAKEKICSMAGSIEHGKMNAPEAGQPRRNRRLHSGAILQYFLLETTGAVEAQQRPWMGGNAAAGADDCCIFQACNLTR